MPKIASLNLCLGLPNKKNLVKELIIEHKLDILCMQETETESNLDHNLLSLPGFDFESETNNVKARVAVYIKSSLSYIRKRDLEGCGLHIIIIDLKCDNNLRLINIYRSFNPQDGSTAREFFHLQINKVRAAFTENTILLGDFNLDWHKKCTQTYQFRNYFEYLLTSLNDFNFTQMVKFPTWSRNVNMFIENQY